ncbi:hypothetical protein Tco_0879335 [Tanacetum coccineum]
MCERHEVDYVQYGSSQNQNSQDSYSHQTYHDSNNSEKSLTELNIDVKNDLEDFKRCMRSMRTIHYKFFEIDDGKTTCVLPNKKSKPQPKTDLEKSITKFLDGQRLAKHTSLCFLDRWKSALRTSLDEDVRGYDVIITEDGRGGGHLVFLIGGRISQNRIDPKMYSCQDNKGMGKQHGVSIMAAEDAMLHVTGVVNNEKGFELEKTLDVTKVDVGCPGKVEMVRKKGRPLAGNGEQRVP